MARTDQIPRPLDHAHRDAGHSVERWARRALLAALTLVCLAGLLSVFGQRPTLTAAEIGAARLSVSAPSAVRGGLLFQARITIEAGEDLDSATIVLADGWTEGMTINTIEPSPVRETSRDGRLALDFGHIGAGRKLVAFLQFQVNPTNIGRRSQDIELYDGERLLARLDRTVTVYP